MRNFLRKIIFKIQQLARDAKEMFSLSDYGERVDISYAPLAQREKQKRGLDMYQASHFARYEFAQTLLRENDTVADFACGTGYGSLMLAENTTRVIGADINGKVIDAIQKRYKKYPRVSFVTADLLNLEYNDMFDKVISFETIEHFSEENIPKLFVMYTQALKSGGILIFSTPYMQQKTEKVERMGFHLTFDIDENKIASWLNRSGLKLVSYKYQNYTHPDLTDILDKKDFIVCVAQKP